jgi:putative MATE family efflux protein
VVDGETEDARLTRGSIPRHLLEQTAPMVVGIACVIGVGLLDAFFIGQLGTDELTAMSFLFPVTVAMASIGVGVLVGVNSVVSRALGAGDRRVAHARAVQGVAFAGLVGAVFAVGLSAGQGPLFRLLQAKDELQPVIAAYVGPYALGYPLLLVAMSSNAVLRAQGQATRASSILVLVGVVNLILDPVFIFGAGPLPALGVAGAAWATTVAHVLAMMVGLTLVAHSALPWRLGSARSDPWRGVRAVADVGVFAALSNAVNPLGLASLTAILATESPQAVAGFGAASRVQSFAVVPLLALSSGIGPVTGQNWGAGSDDRARAALRTSARFCIGYGLAVAVPLTATRQSVAAAFTTDPGVQAEIAAFLLIATWGLFAYGLLIVANGALNAVGQAALAFRISLARVALFMLPVAFAGAALGGPRLVYGAYLVANLAGGLLAVTFAGRALRPPRLQSP